MMNDDFDKEFDKKFKMAAKTGVGMIVLIILANLVLFGGLIYLGLWLLRNFGII